MNHLSVDKRTALLLFATAAAYFFTGKLGLFFAVPPGLATAVWPPSGIALAAVILGGEKYLGAVALGSFFLNFHTITESGQSTLTSAILFSLIIALGSTLQTWVGNRLIRRNIPAKDFFTTGRTTFAFIVAEVGACLVAATIGTIQILVMNPESPALVNWLTWYLGDLNGVFIFTPMLLMLARVRWQRFEARLVSYLETFGFLSLLLATLWFVFGRGATPHSAYLLTIFILWAAFRFPAPGLALTTFLIAMVSVYATAVTQGTTAYYSAADSLLFCQAFLGVLSVAGLMVRATLTERYAIEADLRKSETNYRAVFELSSIGKCQIEFGTGKIVEANQKLSEITGYTKEELCGMFLSELQEFSSSQQSLIDRNWFLTPNQTSARSEVRFRRKSGEVIDVELNVFLLNPIAELSAHMIVIAQEITERKSIEEERKRLTKNLERANEELQTFTYGASHDLKEPLRTISSHLSLYKRSMKPEEKTGDETLLNYAIDAAKRMSALVDSLMLYGKVDALREQMRTFDLNTIMGRVIADLQFAINESKANIRWTNLPEISGNPTLLCQLLENLISNAIKFRGERSLEIEIKAWMRGEFWLFCVKDNGIGIDMQHAKTIFLPFKRLHSSQEYSGSGLGLATCRKIVHLHGGSLWVESVPGVGSEFFFTLLRAQPVTSIARTQATT